MKIARVGLHNYEEPIISGKNGSGTIFFSGCNLKCVFCQNYEISHGKKGIDVSIGTLKDLMLYLQSIGAENINLVTPSLYVKSIASALERAKIDGLDIPVVYNTSSYETVETLKILDGLVDVY
ncbi:MAG: radical SAM protein, partial [Eubacteriales bacterium]|nr:radical SAM protein [Eubacteriales bacterium]